MDNLRLIIGIDDRYMISSQGLIYVKSHFEEQINKNTGKIIKVFWEERWIKAFQSDKIQLKESNNTYLGYDLPNLNGKLVRMLFHNMVGEAFVPKPVNFDPNKFYIRHKNGNIADNRAENLHWVDLTQERIINLGQWKLTQEIVDNIREQYFKAINDGLNPNMIKQCKKYGIGRDLYNKVVRNILWVNDDYVPLKQIRRPFKLNLTIEQINEIDR